MIGSLIMTHSDDIGLRLPPRIAPKQIVIVPILRGDAVDDTVLDYAVALEKDLKKLTYADEIVRVHVDKRDRLAPDKKWEWIKKGAPILIEVGPRDVESNKVAVRIRTSDNPKADFMTREDFITKAPALLDQVQTTLFEQAVQYRDQNLRTDIKNFTAFQKYFADKNDWLGGKGKVGFVRAPWSGDIEATEAAFERNGRHPSLSSS